MFMVKDKSAFMEDLCDYKKEQQYMRHIWMINEQLLKDLITNKVSGLLFKDQQQSAFTKDDYKFAYKDINRPKK